MTPDEVGRVAVELAEMRGEIRTGFTELAGRLELAMQRTGQTEQRTGQNEHDIRALAARVEVLERGDTERQKRDSGRLTSLEAARWPLPSLAAAAGLGSLGVTLYTLIAR